MSHIVQDRVKDAWRSLNSAENAIDSDKWESSKAISCCQNALLDLENACRRFLDDERWIRNTEIKYNNKLHVLKNRRDDGNIEEKEIEELINDLREEVKEAKERCEAVGQEKDLFESITFPEGGSSDYIF